MSFYEWNLYFLRWKHKEEEKFKAEEYAWARTRAWLVQTANLHRGKGKTIIKPTDLFELSFDKESVNESKPPDEDIFKRLVDKYGKTLKK